MLLAITALTATLAGSALADPPKVLSDGVATFQQSHQYLLRDQKTGREFLVRVAEPTKQPPVGQKAPVFYVLDGNWYFGLATDIARMIPIGTYTPPSFVVSIGYNVSDFEDVVANREHDLMFGYFLPDRPGVGGGGAAFQSFLINDLRPFIEQRYAIDSNRAYLAGQSLGGQFAARVLLSQPDSFAGFLIGSPSRFDEEVLLGARRFSKGGGQRVMVGVGDGESPPTRAHAMALAASLSRPEADLAVSMRVFENQHHMSMHGPWFAEGFRYLLDGPAK